MATLKAGVPTTTTTIQDINAARAARGFAPLGTQTSTATPTSTPTPVAAITPTPAPAPIAPAPINGPTITTVPKAGITEPTGVKTTQPFSLDFSDPTPNTPMTSEDYKAIGSRFGMSAPDTTADDTQIAKARQDYLTSISGKSEETKQAEEQVLNIQKQIGDFDLALQKGQQEQYGLGRPLTLSTGRAQQLATNSQFEKTNLLNQEKNLLSKLGLAQETEKMQQEGYKNILEYATNDRDFAIKLQESTNKNIESVLGLWSKYNDQQRSLAASFLEKSGIEKVNFDALPDETKQQIYSTFAQQYGITDPNAVRQLMIAKHTEWINEQAKITKGTTGTSGVSNTDPILQQLINNPQLINSSMFTPTTRLQYAQAMANQGVTIPPALSAQQIKDRDNAESALSALDTIQNEVDKNFTTFRNPDWVLSFTNPTIAQAKREASDVVTRLRTGAALNENEIKFYSNYVPTYKDSKQSAQYKIDTLKSFYKLFTDNPGDTFPMIKKRLAAQLQPGEILAQNKQTGEFQAITSKEYDPDKYLKLSY